MTTSSPEQSSAPTGPGGAEASLLKTIELIASIVAPVTVLSALLYYFGWVRTNAVFRYFGADPAILGFGVPEYVARSAGTAFAPVVIVLLVAALVLLVGRIVDVVERRWAGVPVTIRGHRWMLRP